MKKTQSVQGEHKGGNVSRAAMYLKASNHFFEALDTLVDLMRNARQESVRASAANKLIDKVLPDLKATELTGEDGGAIQVRHDISIQLNKVYGDESN